MEKSFLLFLIFEGLQGRPEDLVAAMHKRNDAMQNDAHAAELDMPVRKTAISPQRLAAPQKLRAHGTCTSGRPRDMKC
jgi:hypothetical protein